MQVDQQADSIWVRGATEAYGDTPENFAKDYGQPCEPLPDGITRREYVPSIRHTYKIDINVVGGGPMPWPFGDEVLSNLTPLLEAQATRREIEEKERQDAEMEVMQAKAASMGVQFRAPPS